MCLDKYREDLTGELRGYQKDTDTVESIERDKTVGKLAADVGLPIATELNNRGARGKMFVGDSWVERYARKRGGSQWRLMRRSQEEDE